MRIPKSLVNGIGLLALAASFALASPGVKVVRAETLASEEAPAMCAAEAERKHSKDAAIAGFLDTLRSRQQERGLRLRPEVVMLNNRGYNYEAARIELDEVLAEVRARP